MSVRRYALKLTLEGPVHTASSEVGSFGVDSPLARLGDGRPYIPGSLVIGRIRHALEELREIARTAGRADEFEDQIDIEALFGGAGDEDRGQDNRRNIFVSDLVASNCGDKSGQRTRIAIDPVTGAAREGALQVLESPWAIGEEVVFEGELRLRSGAEEPGDIGNRIKNALEWAGSFGAMRTIGYGVLKSVEIEDPEKSRPKFASSLTDAAPDRVRIVLIFDEPFCIADTRNAGNVFISSGIIPGAAIKAALVALDPEGKHKSFRAAIDAIRFTHLLPVPKPETELDGKSVKLDLEDLPQCLRDLKDLARAGPPPFSLALGDKKQPLADLSLCSGEHLLDGFAPQFEPDWKWEVREKADKLSGWSMPGRSLRVRTAIDRDRRRARTGQLFAYEVTQTDGHVWVGDIDLADVDKACRWKVVEDIKKLAVNGLVGLGRTGSSAKVALLDARAPQPPLDKAGLYVLKLMTPALLRAPDGSYEDAFRAISEGALSLERGFWRERLAGAEFLANRFFAGKPYRPFLLTEAGSVFVLRAADDRDAAVAKERLSAWIRGGLPLSNPVREAYGYGQGDDDAALWKQCPYIRHNGYGEVACMTQFAADNRPGKGRLQALEVAADE